MNSFSGSGAAALPRWQLPDHCSLHSTGGKCFIHELSTLLYTSPSCRKIKCLLQEWYEWGSGPLILYYYVALFDELCTNWLLEFGQGRCLFWERSNCRVLCNFTIWVEPNTCWLPPASFLLWEGICFGSYLQSFLFLCTCCDNVLFSPMLLPVVLFCVSYFVNPVLRPIFFFFLDSFKIGRYQPSVNLVFTVVTLFRFTMFPNNKKTTSLTTHHIYVFAREMVISFISVQN